MFNRLLCICFIAFPTVAMAAGHVEFECQRQAYPIELSEIEDSVFNVSREDDRWRIEGEFDRLSASPIIDPTVFEFTMHAHVAGVLQIRILRIDRVNQTVTIARGEWDQNTTILSCDEVVLGPVVIP